MVQSRFRSRRVPGPGYCSSRESKPAGTSAAITTTQRLGRRPSGQIRSSEAVGDRLEERDELGLAVADDLVEAAVGSIARTRRFCSVASPALVLVSRSAMLRRSLGEA